MARYSVGSGFEAFQIVPDLLGDRYLMHCLLSHRGEEVTDETIESDQALIWQQAQKMHAQNGLLAWLQSESEGYPEPSRFVAGTVFEPIVVRRPG